MPLLEMTHVSKEYTKGTKALSDIHFSVEEGEFISIIGKSGAGKSTLLRCINRMIDPSEGMVMFDGVDTEKLITKELRELRRQIGMIFQHYNLVNRLSVLDNTCHGRLGYTSTLRGVFGAFTNEDKAHATTILEQLGLKEQIHQRCDQLSGGQKQRVGIARALVQNPKLILCDEPIASLDPSSSRIIMEYLKDINKKMGITVICNLHQVDVAIAYSKRIIGVNGGQIVFDGTPDELTQEKIHEIYGSEAGELITDISA